MPFPDAQCELTVFQYLYNAGGHPFSDLRRLCGTKEFFFRDECGEAVIHRYECTEIFADLIDSSCHHVIFFIRAVCAQLFVDIHGRAESAAFVDIKGSQHLISGFYFSCLLFEGQEQILLQSPVQESSDFADLHYRQQCHLSHD